MKSNQAKRTLVLVMVLMLITAMLAGCVEVNVSMQFNEDGSGVIGSRWGFEEEEIKNSGMTVEEFLIQMETSDEMKMNMNIGEADEVKYLSYEVDGKKYAGMQATTKIDSVTSMLESSEEGQQTLGIEHKNGKTTIYIVSDMSANDVMPAVMDGEPEVNQNSTTEVTPETEVEVTAEVTGNIFSEDVIEQMGGVEALMEAFKVSCTVNLPGQIVGHNATKENGNVLTWDLMNIAAQENEETQIAFAWTVPEITSLTQTDNIEEIKEAFLKIATSDIDLTTMDAKDENGNTDIEEAKADVEENSKTGEKDTQTIGKADKKGNNEKENTKIAREETDTKNPVNTTVVLGVVVVLALGILVACLIMKKKPSTNEYNSMENNEEISDEIEDDEDDDYEIDEDLEDDEDKQ